VFEDNSHISDEDLLKALDQEHSGTRSELIRFHLRACWNCRARSAEIERSIYDFVRTYEQNLCRRPSTSERAYAVLRFRLSQVAGATPPPSSRMWMTRMLLCLISLAGVGGAFAWLEQHPVRPNVRVLPDPRLTPGLARTVNRDDVCSASSRPNLQISATLARQVFREYGVTDPPAGAYEVDYLISPELGGADDIRNAWPEPYTGSEWSAHVKDALEERLRRMVCNKTLDLSAAQQEIADDWVSSYKKRFQTNHPLVEHLAYTKDTPWR
jgi:hypothetical protein